MSPFKPAERKRAKLRLGICGPSGSGKTYSALQIALGLGGKIALIDTENGSGELYADVGKYDTAPLNKPYTPQRYIDLIHEAEKAGYDVIILDSITHAWAGEGGLLDEHDKITASSRSKNSYMAWRDVTPKHNALIEAMMSSPAHIIATMRTKVNYILQDDGHGKQKPVKVGMAPIQREGMDYEFTVVFDLSVDKHLATVSKDRTGLFDGNAPFVPKTDTGAQLIEWLERGVDMDMKIRAESGEAIKQCRACTDEGELKKHVDKHRETSRTWGKYRETWVEETNEKYASLTEPPEQHAA